MIDGDWFFGYYPAGLSPAVIWELWMLALQLVVLAAFWGREDKS